MKRSWSFTFPGTKNNSEDDGTESVYSYQDVETEFAKDTSDTCSKSDNDSSNAEEELELVSSSSDQDKSDGSTSTGSSVLETFLGKIVPIICLDDGGLLADTSDGTGNETSYDPEVPRADYWHCAQCKSSSNDPRYRYCEQCYTVRKTFFPPRPRGGKRLRKKNSLKAALGNLGSSDLSSGDEKSTARQALSLHVPQGVTVDRIASVASTSSSQDSSLAGTFHSQETLSGSLSSATSSLSQKSLDSDDANNCNSCHAHERNGLFLHNNTGHNWSCYTCSKKIWRRTKRCPVCNRTVTKVIKIFKD